MRDERREQIMEAALKLFAARGLSATKIVDIASESGISQGLFYHYFRSKEELFVELIRDAFGKMNSAAHALEALPLSGGEKIDKAIVALLGSLEEERFSRTVMLIAQATVSEATPEEAKGVILAERGVPYEVVARIMEAGQEDGSIKREHDAEQLSVVFWTMIKGLALHKAANGETFKAPDAAILTGIFLPRRE